MFSLLTRIWDKDIPRKYPALRSMLTIYFNGEHDDFGTTIDEIMDSYTDHNASSREELITEIVKLSQIPHEEQLNAIMEKLAEHRFHPSLWGETWRSFLAKVYCHFER